MKKIISLMLALALVICLLPGVSAAEGVNYLALGDSITAGTGLKSGESSFAKILAEDNGWNLTNLATASQTSESLLKQIKGGSNDEAIKSAKFITITAGANDMMNLMFGLIVDTYNESNTPSITVADVYTILKNGTSDDRFWGLAAATMTVVGGDVATNVPAFADREEFKACVDSLASNLEGVVNYIRKLNPDVTVIVSNQYNPFGKIGGMFQSFMGPIKAAAEKLNTAITSAGEKSGYDVVDAFTAFDESEENLCNASGSPVNLDINPNAKGHKVIAGLMQEIVDSKIVKYLALGDSITAGSALNEGEPAFPEILAENNGWKLTNMGENGQTAGSLLEQLESGSCDEAIAAAKVITITAGGNDIMDAMYELLAEGYNAAYDPDITADDIIPILTNPQDDRFFNLLMVGMTLLNGNEADGIPAFADRPEFQEKVDEGVANMEKIMDYIRSLNADAPVIITTQYNPYKDFGGMYSLVTNSVDAGARKLNAAIKEAAKDCGYLVADVYLAFQYSKEVLCNATDEPLNLDFHPNAKGHEVIAQLIQNIVDGKPEPNHTPFVDVKTTDYFYESVLWAVYKGITDGTSDTTFSPILNCDRGQVVTFLWRAAGEPEPTITENPFEDVDPSKYYYKAVLWAVEKGITDGTDDTHFSPAIICTRSQVVTFLYRAAGEPTVADNECYFTDVVAGEWYEDAVLWAVEKGITDGTTDTTFSPNLNCDRGQVVTFLFRAR